MATTPLPACFDVIAIIGALVVPQSAVASHAGTADRDCSDFAYQEDAQSYFTAHGGPNQDPDRLDGDGDGEACDSLPRRTASMPTAPAAPAEPDNDVMRKRETMRRAKIVSVIDGDTIKVRLASGKRVTVRLIGVDTPETRKPGTAIECGGKQATANMRRLALERHRGRGVTLVTDPTQHRVEVFGRLLAYARVDNGRDLAREQIRAGWGTVYATAFARLATYEATQAAAKNAKRGVWRTCGGDFHTAAIATTTSSR